MPTHQIEIDEDVHSFLMARAEELLQERKTPFVDTTPNGILRRELFSDAQPHFSTAADTARATNDTPQFPIGTPAALQQILEVVHVVRGGRHTRTEATNAVARSRKVTPQAVLDKYTRQLGLTASEFDHLLAEERLSGLRALLHKKFKGHIATIETVLR
jgi:hypothetical protein